MMRTLDELYAAMLRRDECTLDRFGQWSSTLPTYGGKTPLDAMEIWSWDKDRLIVGTCPQDLEIVPRPWKGSEVDAPL